MTGRRKDTTKNILFKRAIAAKSDVGTQMGVCMRKKRCFALLMTVFMALGTAGCGNSNPDSQTGSQEDAAGGDVTAMTGTQSGTEESQDAVEVDISEFYDISIWRYKEDFKYEAFERYNK